MTRTQELSKRRKAPSLTSASDIRPRAARDITRPQQFQTSAAGHQVAAASISVNETILPTRQMRKHTLIVKFGSRVQPLAQSKR